MIRAIILDAVELICLAALVAAVFILATGIAPQT